MNDIKIFDNENLGKVRVIHLEDEPWFVLKDVCDVLGLRAPDARQRLSDDVVSTHTVKDSLGRANTANIINEDGLYDVIIDSRKPEAKAFRKWITKEVLPSIRKTGAYHDKSDFSLSPSQVKHLLNLCKLFAYEEPRKAAEKKHFNWYNDKYTWNAYRQGLLGYSVGQLKEAVLKLGVKYRNQNQALIHIDKHRLIYNAVVDLFIALGKTKEYAKNVASFCYEVGKEHPELLTWDRKDNRLFPPSKGIQETEMKYLAV